MQHDYMNLDCDLTRWMQLVYIQPKQQMALNGLHVRSTSMLSKPTSTSSS